MSLNPITAPAGIPGNQTHRGHHFPPGRIGWVIYLAMEPSQSNPLPGDNPVLENEGGKLRYPTATRPAKTPTRWTEQGVRFPRLGPLSSPSTSSLFSDPLRLLGGPLEIVGEVFAYAYD